MCLDRKLKTFRVGQIPKNKPRPHDLNITFWNINGYNSRIVGNKLVDPDFLAEVKKSDIIGLGETHIHNEILEKLCIPDFVRLKYKSRNKSTSNNRSFGGIAVFAKKEISKILRPVETGNQDIIWLKMNKDDSGLTNDIYIGTAYISPQKGKQIESSKIQNLAEDIIGFKNQGGEVIIQGDLNARTSNCKDFIEPDKYDSSDQDNCPQTLPLRNSFDKVTDERDR